jgi:clan AA aspartic protease
MTGTVTIAGKATLSVIVRGPRGHERSVDATIDTGFTGYLTLPSGLIAALQLPYRSQTTATLADGSRVSFRIYEAVVIWHGQERDILVLEAQGGVLLGMAMLRGSRLTVDVLDGGGVTVLPLP